MWQWHHLRALDDLRDDLLRREQWRDEGGYIDKGPFPAPRTDVRIQQRERNDETGEVSLRLTPVHGDVVYYEIGSPATPASLRVADLHDFRTSELRLSFLCVDSNGQHDTGDSSAWENKITIKSRAYQAGTERMIELQVAPAAQIRYTTDGSNPQHGGGIYHGPFVVPAGTRVVLAIAERDGVVSEPHRRDIHGGDETRLEIDPAIPASWLRRHQLATTKETYDFLERVTRFEASMLAPRAVVAAPAGRDEWIELVFGERLRVTGEQLDARIRDLRAMLDESGVELEVAGLAFPTGQHLLDWVELVKTELKQEEVEQ